MLSESDLDLAVLVDGKVSAVTLWDLAQHLDKFLQYSKALIIHDTNVS